MRRFVMAPLNRAENMPLERIGRQILYGRSGTPVGYYDGNRIYDLQVVPLANCMAHAYIALLGITLASSNTASSLIRTAATM